MINTFQKRALTKNESFESFKKYMSDKDEMNYSREVYEHLFTDENQQSIQLTNQNSVNEEDDAEMANLQINMLSLESEENISNFRYSENNSEDNNLL